MYRTLYSFPVLAKAGAIIPMDDDPFAAAQENPKALTLRVCPGATNTFTLYEDDNKTEAYQQGVCAKDAYHLYRGRRADLDRCGGGGFVPAPVGAPLDGGVGERAACAGVLSGGWSDGGGGLLLR